MLSGETLSKFSTRVQVKRSQTLVLPVAVPLNTVHDLKVGEV